MINHFNHVTICPLAILVHNSDLKRHENLYWSVSNENLRRRTYKYKTARKLRLYWFKPWYGYRMKDLMTRVSEGWAVKRSIVECFARKSIHPAEKKQFNQKSWQGLESVDGKYKTKRSLHLCAKPSPPPLPYTQTNLFNEHHAAKSLSGNM